MDNVPRILPDGLAARLTSWPVPPAFLEVKKRSGMSWNQMLTTLNCGLGMVWAVDESAVESLKKIALAHGHQTFTVGEVVTGQGEASWHLADPLWEGTEA